MKSKRLIILTGIVVAILLIPLIAMQFSDEVNWSPADFVIAGILLLALGLGIERVIRAVSFGKKRIFIVLLLLILFALLWGELAVGIFGTTFGGN